MQTFYRKCLQITSKRTETDEEIIKSNLDKNT